MSWRKRLARLEESGAVPCRACGKFANDEQLDVGVRAYGEVDPERQEGLEYCSRCGRLLGGLVRLTWE